LRLCVPLGLSLLAAVAPIFAPTASAALAVDQVHDEIQIYNADIAEVGQWTYQQHLNFAGVGQTVPEFPGGFTSNHSLQGTPEFAYGITNSREAGFYLPFAVTGTGEFLSDGAKLRSLFVIPDAAKRSFFYGVNFELGYEMLQFYRRPGRWRFVPLSGFATRNGEFIVNPIVDVSFGPPGEAVFAPAARLARNLGQDRFIGLEYYSDFGKIGNFLPLQQQSQQLYAVTDFKVNTVDVELGVGYGFTAGSDRLMFKAIIGYAFPVPGKKQQQRQRAKRAPGDGNIAAVFAGRLHREIATAHHVADFASRDSINAKRSDFDQACRLGAVSQTAKAADRRGITGAAHASRCRSRPLGAAARSLRLRSAT
jgi:hypothetical protein